jgi:hypothetical protein
VAFCVFSVSFCVTKKTVTEFHRESTEFHRESLLPFSLSFLLKFFIKISLLLINIIPGVDFFIPVQEVKIKKCKISRTHCCMNEEKQRKAPSPQTRQKNYKKQKYCTYNKEGCHGHNPELKRGCNMLVSCNIKDELFKIHSNPDVFCSGSVIRYYM